jgi:hypothetical protein
MHHRTLTAEGVALHERVAPHVTGGSGAAAERERLKRIELGDATMRADLSARRRR